MIVQQFTQADMGRITELHAQSRFDYSLPSFSHKGFFSRRVIKDDTGLGMAAFLKLTAEAYLICDPCWRNPAWRFEGLRQLSKQCNDDAKDAGVTEVNAFLPPSMSLNFGRRLGKLGWQKVRNDWQCLYKEVE